MYNNKTRIVRGSLELRGAEELFAGAALHFTLAVALSVAGGGVPQRLHLPLQPQDAKLCLLEVLVQPLYLALHAALNLQCSYYYHPLSELKAN